MLNEIRKTLATYQNPIRAQNPLFYKTGPGEYAEHDKFIGVSTPNLRIIAKKYANIPLDSIETLLASRINEERLLALLILVDRYQAGSIHDKNEIYTFYITHTDGVNNWNLVDASAHLIIGAHLSNKNKKLLTTFAKSNNLWERRIAIVSTWYFIKQDQYNETLKIATLLLQDNHDLIHKATGWMLREMGKRDTQTLTDFLEQNANRMPRTMLRYAIEKLPKKEKTYFLNKK